MIVPIILAAVVIVLDQLSKYMVTANMVIFEDIPVISGFFHITYVQNTGMAWSMLSGQQLLLSVAAAVAIGVMLWVLMYKKPGRLLQVSLGLMIGGAAGNLIDRLLFNYVRDFLNFYIFGYDFPVFNIADCALCIGVAFLILDSLLEERKEKGKS
ncbi:MAG: signal peptidase II [Bulleidia sp.]